jgi:hypothetical protein
VKSDGLRSNFHHLQWVVDDSRTSYRKFPLDWGACLPPRQPLARSFRDFYRYRLNSPQSRLQFPGNRFAAFLGAENYVNVVSRECMSHCAAPPGTVYFLTMTHSFPCGLRCAAPPGLCVFSRDDPQLPVWATLFRPSRDLEHRKGDGRSESDCGRSREKNEWWRPVMLDLSVKVR